MTVKLAKFFTSNNSSSSGSGSGSNNSTNSLGVAPTAQISTTNAHNYYQVTNHQMQHQQRLPQQQQQQHYNPYMDDDDNMSLYSTTGSIMTSRDHPFNNSQRPLLGNERKPPQLLLNKKKMNAAYAINQTQQQQQQQQQYKSCISPYVQQQKRDSAKGLHGFNDFDILSQQYNNHLQSPHIGYPYGSPPSPTANSNDFVFDTLQQQQQHQQQQVKCNGGTFMDAASVPPTTTTTTMATPKPHYGNISKYTAIVTPTYHHLHPHENHSDNNFNSNGNTNGTVSNSGVGQGCIGKPSRFEDDFCCRRNAQFSKNPNDHIDTLSHDSGPFIFGITHEQEQHSNLQPRSRTAIGGHCFSDSSDTVIDTIEDDDENDVKYSALNGRQATMQSTSDTSSSSRDSNSNKGGKFLLRKSKSKKNTKDKECNSETTKTTTTSATTTSTKATIKCVVVGDGAVGKTNLILSYLENRFNTEHVPTASDIYNADVMVNDSPVHLTLCDTAGQDTLDPLRELCYPDSDVFLLCFSVAKPESFHAIKTKWAPKFSKTKAALILVGTQADLRTNSNVLNKLQTNGQNPISYADAWDLATTIGAKYIETSSVTQDKVKEVFDTAIWEGLAPTTLPTTPALWKKLFCLA